MTQYMFTSYDDDGRVVATGRASNPEEQVSEVGGYVTGIIYDGDQFYFDPLNSYAPTARPAAPSISFSSPFVPADGTTEILLQGVPAGATVRLGDQEAVADGNDIPLTTTLAGINKVIVDAFPAQLWIGTFDGTA